eukprot:scaffold82577_cov25-Attheya_sp.AAC.2
MTTENENGAPADGVPIDDGGETEPQDDSFTPVTKKSTPKTTPNPNVQQKIKNRGAEQIEISDFMTTPVKLEFNLTNRTEKFNPRPKHLEFSKLIKTIDPSAVIQSVADDTGVVPVPDGAPQFHLFRK